MASINISDIIQHGRENKITVDLLIVPKLEIGEYVAQGDINLICIPHVPTNTFLIKNPNKQIVSGNTRGSRHCLNSLSNVKIYQLKNANLLQICVIEFLGGETILEHPEHKNLLWNQPMTVLVSRQRMFADEVRAITD